MTDLRAQLQEGLGGGYTLERELGRGGMATVFLANDTKHDRPVALKVLHPELAASLGPERFQREIRLAARLQHPHILTVLDSGEAGGRLWFTMPLVEGESLRDRLRRERQLPVEDALRIGHEAAQALQYAHDHGVVHRDIKPENLLLTRDGNTLVADFGIARALGAAGEDRLTETGLAVGTPAYMSPEQAAGDRGLDARTDIYSLAAVLYEMLAGEPPFSGATTQAMLVRRLTEPPPSVRTTRPNVPESVDQAIRKGLAPVAADRFGTMAHLGQVLQGGAASTASGARIETAAPAGAPTAAAPITVATAPAPARRRVPLAAAALLIGLLIGGGALFAWRRGHQEVGGGAGERRVAVLPFQNLGDSADAYFADGMTDAVRGKLTALPTMLVTASNSSTQYRGTTKTPREIGRELGVDYLLVGKVRWAKNADGTSRVQVSPELIEVASASAKWQQPFDASLTDVFQVQADIAGRVARALDVAIGTRQQRALEERPTRNLAAYDAYLKGQAARAFGPNPVNIRQSLNYFEQAVALDSGFVQAWVALSGAGSLLYANGSPSPALADRARSAADRALALNPEFPGGYWALGTYHRLVSGNSAPALQVLTKGLALAPNDADLLRGLGLTEQALGQWDQSVEHLRRSRALDPRAAGTASVLGTALASLRRYDEAMEAAEAAQVLQPSDMGNLESIMMIHLARGDLAGAKALAAQPPPGVDLPGFLAYLSTYYDLYWVLDGEQRALVKRLTPAAFDGDAGTWGLALAGMYEVEGDMRRAAAYADSARAAFEQQLTAAPEDAQRHVLLGLALAYTGRKAAAIREGERGAALAPISSDAQSGAYLQHQLARIYILVGEPEKALDRLEPLLRMPYYLSPGWLRIDPTFDPLRNNPRFKRLSEAT
jgi:eukaryotic-like serine/threonine-protein kinase